MTTTSHPHVGVGDRADLAEREQPLRPPKWIVLTIAGIALILVGGAAGYRPIAGVGVLLAVAIGFVLLRYPVTAGVLLAGVIPVVSGLKRGLLIPGFRISEVAIVGLGFLILTPLEARRAARWQSFDWLALAYAAATAALGWLDTVNRGATLSTTDLGTMLGPLQYLIMYRAISTILRTRDQQRRGLRLVISLSLVVSLLAIAQQLDVPGIRSFLATVTGANLYGPNPSEGGLTLTVPPRASGPYPFWHETGGYLMIIIIIIVGLLLDGRQRCLPRRWLVAILLIDAAALVETVTIAPILGAVIGVVAIGVWYRRSRVVLAYLLAGAVVFGGIYFPLLQARSAHEFTQAPGAAISSNPLIPQTIAYRLMIYSTQDIPLLKGRWLTGYGPSLPSSYTFGFTESLYFTLLVRGGLILLAVYIALMWALAQRAATALRSSATAEQLIVARTVLVIVVLLIFIQFLEGYFVDTGPADLVWVLAALLVQPATRTASHVRRRSGRAWSRSADKQLTGDFS